ncbi:MAG: peroxiredoxin [Planctomycetota bacterium]|jgi:peroxiredoxin
MTIIEAGATAPSFELDGHLSDKVSSASFAGKKNLLLVFYPLDFTPT